MLPKVKCTVFYGYNIYNTAILRLILDFINVNK